MPKLPYLITATKAGISKVAKLPIFSVNLMTRQYSIFPVAGLTGVAVGLGGMYLGYRCRNKPDVSFRLRDKDMLPEWLVVPDANMKLVSSRPVKYNTEVEALKMEINNHFKWCTYDRAIVEYFNRDRGHPP